MTNNFKIAIVATVHIQPSKEWVASLQSITEGKKNVSIIVVDDSDGKVELPKSWDVYGYDRQKEKLGDLYPSFERFHKSSACKNFGHWIAYQEGFDIVMGLDSDCVVPPNFISDHVANLMKTSRGWVNPIEGTGWFSRGFPMHERARRTILSLGLWSGELDLYGTDRMHPSYAGLSTKDPLAQDARVADGILPLSGMNWACWAEAIPALLFLPNFDYAHRPDVTYRFRRHDDIWGGYIFQRLMGGRNERIVYGKPVVFHDTVVKPEEDAKEEEAMIAFEYSFFTAVDAIVASIEPGLYEDMFEAFVKKASKAWKGTEFDGLVEPLQFWSVLFSGVALSDDDSEEQAMDKELEEETSEGDVLPVTGLS